MVRIRLKYNKKIQILKWNVSHLKSILCYVFLFCLHFLFTLHSFIFLRLNDCWQTFFFAIFKFHHFCNLNSYLIFIFWVFNSKWLHLLKMKNNSINNKKKICIKTKKTVFLLFRPLNKQQHYFFVKFYK